LGGRRWWCGSHGAGFFVTKTGCFLLQAFRPGGYKNRGKEKRDVTEGADKVGGFVIHLRRV